MNAAQAQEYIGLPWASDGVGPDAYNCWNLLRHLLDEYFNRHLPEAPVGDEEACRLIHAECIANGSWEVVQFPQHGDAVLMKDGSNPHVGLYLDIDGGGILHSMEGVGVVFTPLQSLRRVGFGRVKYYRIHV